jgi:hypothetical protein
MVGLRVAMRVETGNSSPGVDELEGTTPRILKLAVAVWAARATTPGSTSATSARRLGFAPFSAVTSSALTRNWPGPAIANSAPVAA